MEKIESVKDLVVGGRYPMSLNLVCPGGWDHKGCLVSTYNRPLDGDMEFIGEEDGKLHFYHNTQGVDVHLSKEHVIDALNGVETKIGIKEYWG